MKQKDVVITLNAEESREAFDREVQYRIGMSVGRFIEEWRHGNLDLDNPDVKWLVELGANLGIVSRDA